MAGMGKVSKSFALDEDVWSGVVRCAEQERLSWSAWVNRVLAGAVETQLAGKQLDLLDSGSRSQAHATKERRTAGRAKAKTASGKPDKKGKNPA